MINKLDNYKPEKLFDYYALGLGEPFGISCEQSTGIGDLLDDVCSHLEKIEEEELILKQLELIDGGSINEH